jgi:hypothetical protein
MDKGKSWWDFFIFVDTLFRIALFDSTEGPCRVCRLEGIDG